MQAALQALADLLFAEEDVEESHTSQRRRTAAPRHGSASFYLQALAYQWYISFVEEEVEESHIS